VTDNREAITHPESGAHARPQALPTAAERGASLDRVLEVSSRLAAAMNSVIEGKQDVVRTAITTLLAEGHLLIEDVPGVGKTMLAKTLARSIDCSVRRVQFTPDLLPSDITGVSVFNQDVRDFEFRPGAIFANVVVGDEINRASPKTQSALLESMEEGQVTVDGTTYTLPRPFIVMATQNPIEMEGTYPLPEAQRDRFLARISMGYPSAASEIEMLDAHAGTSPLETLAPVTDAATVSSMIAAVRSVYASPAIRAYLVDLTHATRTSSALRLGASPRATLHLLRAAKAHAALAGRDHVLPDDAKAVAIPVLAHRLIPTGETLMARRSVTDVLNDLLHRVRVPATPR
jgi:MoxR-like ATPase